MHGGQEQAMSVIDTARSQAFGERALDIVNSGCLSLMLSIGHRTGLFDTLATLAPSTADQIAAAARLNERYVREWLGAMVTGWIIEYDPPTRTYRLPQEHVASLTRSRSGQPRRDGADRVAPGPR
jgi:hypothetical protein